MCRRREERGVEVEGRRLKTEGLERLTDLRLKESHDRLYKLKFFQLFSKFSF
jgi:hypothetical protein